MDLAALNDSIGCDSFPLPAQLSFLVAQRLPEIRCSSNRRGSLIESVVDIILPVILLRVLFSIRWLLEESGAKMSRIKQEHYPQFNVDELADPAPNDLEEKLGTERDQRDMVRMGKKQELRRGFRFPSITGYAMILGCSWEFALM